MPLSNNVSKLFRALPVTNWYMIPWREVIEHSPWKSHPSFKNRRTYKPKPSTHLNRHFQRQHASKRKKNPDILINYGISSIIWSWPFLPPASRDLTQLTVHLGLNRPSASPSTNQLMGGHRGGSCRKQSRKQREDCRNYQLVFRSFFGFSVLVQDG